MNIVYAPDKIRIQRFDHGDIRFIEGRMTHSSKRQAKPEERCVFNANLCTKEDGKIWHGDLRLAKDEGAIKALATALGKKIYVLREMDARFEREKTPRFEAAVAEFEP